MQHETKRSLTKSCEVPVKAKIIGQIPKWVSGTLFKNGPGRYEFGEKRYEHLFDGQACIQKFRIENGQVEYSNKLLETKSYCGSLNDDRLYPQFGPKDLGLNIFGRLKQAFNPPDTNDNVNINVAPFADSQLYAMTEGHLICQIDPKDLKVKNTFKLNEYFNDVVTSIAHPHVEQDGSWITPYVNGKKFQYEFVKYDASAHISEEKSMLDSGKIIASIPSSHRSGVSYFHSFGITKNYIILLEQSLLINFFKMFYHLIVNKPLSDAIVKYPDWNSRIRVIDRNSGREISQKYYTDPLITFHHINAYEKNDADNSNKLELIVDFVGYDANKFEFNKIEYKETDNEDEILTPFAKRITVPINLNSKSNTESYCKTEILNSKYSIEFPAINYNRYNGKPYKYLYGLCQQKKLYSTVKINVDDENDVKFKNYHEEGRFLLPLEPVFVESPDAESEDDGVLLVMVLSDKTDFLSILDAKNMNEIARAELPDDTKIAMAFHGFFADIKKFKTLNF